MDLKNISVKSVFTNNLTFINTWNARLGFKFQKTMPVTSLYWLAAQQQFSILRRQRSSSIYSKFSVEFTELTPSLQNSHKEAWKLQKPKNDREMEIYLFRNLRVKARLKNLQKYLKPSFVVFTSSMVKNNLENISTESVLTSNLTFINP